MDLDLVSASVIVALNLGMDKSTKDAYNALKTASRRKIDGDIDAVLKLLEENPASKPGRVAGEDCSDSGL